jgi:hypothetical protein
MSQLEMPGASSLLDLRMPEDETRHKCLKTLVQYLNWTYGVIWKLSPGDRFDLEWVDGWFDPTSFKSGHTLMPQFYSIFKTCNFRDPSAHGYSALALRQGASFWWTSQMAEVPTDKCKARFLQVTCQAHSCRIFGRPSTTSICGNLSACNTCSFL